MDLRQVMVWLLVATASVLAYRAEALAQEDRLHPCDPEVCVFTGRGITQEGLVNNEGLCITDVHPQVSGLLVECLDSGFEGVVLFNRAPLPRGFIDTRGCNAIRAVAFTTAPRHKEKVEGCVVKYWVCVWPDCSEQVRPGPVTEAQSLAPPVGPRMCNCEVSGRSGGEVREDAPGQSAATGSEMKDMWQDAIESDSGLRRQGPTGKRAGDVRGQAPGEGEGDDLDSILGEKYEAGDRGGVPRIGEAGQSGPVEGPLLGEEPPRSEGEVRDVLSRLGFRVVERDTFGSFPGYRVEIADRKRAAEFGFEEYRREVAGRGLTGVIACWTQKEEQSSVIWIDRRTVRVRHGRSLPSYVKLYAK